MKYSNSKCTHNKVSEAWVQIVGYPDLLNPNESGAIDAKAQKEFKNSKDSSGIIILPQTNVAQSPFWFKERREENIVARFGHKYLSVHFVPDNKNRYESYESSLKPKIENWIEIVKDSVPFPEKDSISRVLFGYVNTFRFSNDDKNKFIIPDYFNIDYAVDIGETVTGLNHVNFNFSFENTDTQSVIELKFGVESIQGSTDFKVMVEVSSAKVLRDSLNFNKVEELLAIASTAKQEAKEAFFSFITENTRNLMGVNNG